MFHVKQFSTDVEFLWKNNLFCAGFHRIFKNKNRGKNPGRLMFVFCKNRFPSTFSIL